MTTPLRPRDTGAYRERRRRGGLPWWLWLLILVLLALVVAGIVALLVHHDRHHGSGDTAGAGTSAAAAPTASTGAAAGAPLVGGGGSAPTAAAGADAAHGVVGTVLFASDSAAIDADGDRVIDAAAAVVRSSGAKALAVTGYTDVVAGAPTNDPLSQERADAVAAKLRALLPGVTVTTAARGEADPIASNDTAAGRAQNRRAVIATSP